MLQRNGVERSTSEEFKKRTGRKKGERKGENKE